MWKCRDGQWGHTSRMNINLHQSESRGVDIMSTEVMRMTDQAKGDSL